MTPWTFADKGISEDPHDGLKDILAQVDQDVDEVLDILAEFFYERPDSWQEFCHAWMQYRRAAIEEADIL